MQPEIDGRRLDDLIGPRFLVLGRTKEALDGSAAWWAADDRALVTTLADVSDPGHWMRSWLDRNHSDVVIVRPGKYGLLGHTMFYVDEIRSEAEFRTDAASVGAKELELAKTFLKALEGPFAPEEFKDEYREQLQAMIAKKVREAGSAPAREATPAATPVVDILEALKKSIAMTRKPAALETQPARKMPGRVTQIKGKRSSRKVR